jgi:hypothetical protein
MFALYPLRGYSRAVVVMVVVVFDDMDMVGLAVQVVTFVAVAVYVGSVCAVPGSSLWNLQHCSIATSSVDVKTHVEKRFVATSPSSLLSSPSPDARRTS